MIVLAVHYAQHGPRKQIVLFLGLTALLGVCFLGFKALEYYIDYRENLIPGWRFDAGRVGHARRAPPRPGAARQVVSVPVLGHDRVARPARDDRHRRRAGDLVLAGRGRFSTEYYAPVDVTALYWHFVDIVWIFLLPTLYLLGIHHW